MHLRAMDDIFLADAQQSVFIIQFSVECMCVNGSGGVGYGGWNSFWLKPGFSFFGRGGKKEIRFKERSHITKFSPIVYLKISAHYSASYCLALC